jgi:site-specific recombinase XerD
LTGSGPSTILLLLYEVLKENPMTDEMQADLFPTAPITPGASIKAALGAFDNFMVQEGLTENTRKAFASDIRLLGKYLGIGQPVGEIGTDNLNDFLSWMRYERGVPCSQKTYARRVTTIKKFFSWLHGSGVLPFDPSAAVIQISVSSPLPNVPSESDIQSALSVTSLIRQGSDEVDPDARPHLLLTLLLKTGIKKSEAMSIVLNHIARDDPNAPYLYVRYTDPGKRDKERKIDLESNWLEVLDEYQAQYEPTDTLFTCTARNLEYILTDVAESAGLEKGQLSFENLRWASALRDYADGVDPTNIRQKLGLSKITWRETRTKLGRLRERQASS